MRVEKYLNEAIARHGLKNDTALAKLLGVRQNAVSQYRSGTRTMDNEMCLHLAQLLDMDNPMPIIMAADMDRAERAGQHSLWEVFSTRMASSATAALLLVLVASATNFVAPSAAKAAPLSHSEGRTVFIMLNIVSAENARFAATEPFPPSSAHRQAQQFLARQR
ncbi:helix-turn-helix domain-containing protein [Ralstonia solanacearum]|uniref:helix-turn-helix domain-containing protein n=1 Tax=Ralstonia solanacearum TaxID=305 RepID=UPI000B0FBA54|nr:helix-turn-helix transcriptional regulator [Ralstonia solanacearum]